MWCLKLYKQSRTTLQQYFKFLQILFNGFWLGLLSYSSLHKIDEIYYNNTSMYYSPKYNKMGLHKWEEQIIKNYFQNCRKLLLVGAGGGREVYALQKMGYEIEAFECNPKLQNFGNKFLAEEGLNPCIEYSERDSYLNNNCIYDGVIVGWGTYMLIQGRIRRIAFLQNIRSQISDDAPILLSFFTRNYDSRKFKVTILIANTLRFLLQRERLQIGDNLEPNYVHYFTEIELSEELREAGLNLLYYSSKSYGHAVAKAIPNL